MSDERNLTDKELILELMKERDWLRAELEKAKQFDLTAAVMAKDSEIEKERDQLRAEVERLTLEVNQLKNRDMDCTEALFEARMVRAAAEKLAEALEATWPNMAPEMRAHHDEALAEYREKFSKE